MKAGWKTQTLGEACRFIDYRGKTPEKTKSGLRLITAKNVKMGHLQVDPLEYVNPDIYGKWMTRGIPKKGDILFTTEAPLANVAQLDTDEKVVFAQRIIILQPIGGMLDRTFLKYFLLSLRAQECIREMGTGATVQGIKASLLKKIEICFPPLPEQHRIVGILDAAFDGLARTKANTEKNLQNARSIFQAQLHASFIECNGSATELVDLKDVLSDQPRNGWSPPATDHSDAGVPVLTLSAVTGFKFRTEKVKYTSAATSPKAHYWVKNGDLLISRSNTAELVGHVAIVENIDTPTIYPDLIMRMNANPAKATNRFLYFQLRSAALRAIITNRAHGANPTMKKVNKGDVQTLPLWIPSIQEQDRIAAGLTELEEQTAGLELNCQRKLKSLDALKKSLLHRAFNGDL